MSKREDLKAELVNIIETHKEGFASGTPEAKRIDALIDEISEHTVYPRALDHRHIYGGHWASEYVNIGRLVGGDGASDQGMGVTTSLRVFSMGRLPDVPATHIGSALEIEPEAGLYNFYSRLQVGDAQVETHHFTYGRFKQKEENPDRFFVEFDRFEITPVDSSMSLEDYCAATGIEAPEELTASLSPSPKLWSHVTYMDDDMRIQLGQLGGHYIMFKTDLPMYSIIHASGKNVDDARVSAA